MRKTYICLSIFLTVGACGLASPLGTTDRVVVRAPAVLCGQGSEEIPECQDVSSGDEHEDAYNHALRRLKVYDEIQSYQSCEDELQAEIDYLYETEVGWGF